MANASLPIGALQKSELETRADDRAAKVRRTEADRRATYRLVELRDGMKCRACAIRVVKTLTVQGNRCEHHHIRGRGAKDSETSSNVCLLCLQCHELRHVKRLLHIAGNADGTLKFERDGNVWRG